MMSDTRATELEHLLYSLALELSHCNNLGCAFTRLEESFGLAGLKFPKWDDVGFDEEEIRAAGGKFFSEWEGS